MSSKWLLVAGCMACGVAFAKVTVYGPYFDIGAGYGWVDTNRAELGLSASDKLSTESIAWVADYGYQFNNYWAIDFGYTILPRVKVTTSPKHKTRYQSNAITIMGKALFPVNLQWSFFAKAGVALDRSSLAGASSSRQAVLAYGLGFEHQVDTNVYVFTQAQVTTKHKRLGNPGYRPQRWIASVGIHYLYP